MRPDASDPFDLQRFVAAQDQVYARVLDELRAGSKRSHWIWYIFPQVSGLGRTPTSITFSIGSKAEARAYIAHAVLCQRLFECTRLLVGIEGVPLAAIMPFPDDLKFISSMTLFAEIADKPVVFNRALERFNHGAPDHRTLELLASMG